jgi:predicted nucleic acid-binding protein
MVERMRRSIEIEDPDWSLVRSAAEIKARGGLSYADAFCVATARRHRAPLYTGDPEIVALDGDDLEVVDLRSAR